jgi:hypothetical protein
MYSSRQSDELRLGTWYVPARRPACTFTVLVASGNAGDRSGRCGANRDAVLVARCTVERLMKALGLHGARRDRTMRTHLFGPGGAAASGPSRAQLQPEQAGRVVGGQLQLTCDLGRVFVYVAFVIDAFSRRSSDLLCRDPIGSGFYLWALRP